MRAVYHKIIKIMNCFTRKTEAVHSVSLLENLKIIFRTVSNYTGITLSNILIQIL